MATAQTPAPTYATGVPTVQFCPAVTEQVIDLAFRPAFFTLDDEQFLQGATTSFGATVSSFVNVESGVLFAPDLVGRVDGTVTVLDDENMVRPRDVRRVPSGTLPFEAVVAPQGFFTEPVVGRLTILDLTGVEYVVAQSTFPPYWYNDCEFFDMDGDGLTDIVAARSGFQAGVTPPSGQLVWFKNPGTNLTTSEWEEFVLFGLGIPGTGPDVALDIADLDGDGVPEIVATHFFTSAEIVLYGAPFGGSWTTVSPFAPPRMAVLSNDQGLPFDVQFVDLNADGQLDVLATNHQSDGCLFPSVPPGRAFALEASGDIFADPWIVHILLDNLFPQPGVARLGPGRAGPFFPSKTYPFAKPWISVGGDEVGKVFILRPADEDATNWSYESAVLFDINDAFPPNTTQTVTPEGFTISTIGRVSVRFGSQDTAEIWFPVFEAKQLRVFTFLDTDGGATCPDDITLPCSTSP